MTEQKNWRMEDGEFTIIVGMHAEYEQYLRAEPAVETLDTAVETMFKEKLSVYQTAQHVFIAETLGHTTEPILGTPKVVLKAGAAERFSKKVSALKQRVKMPTGKEIDIPAVVRKVTAADETESLSTETASEQTTLLTPHTEPPADLLPEHGFPVRVSDPLATQRAMQHLMRRVTGMIRERLAIVAVNDGIAAARALAAELKLAIDEIVAKLAE